MNRAVKRSLILVLLACAFGLLAWRLWPDSAQARRHQRDRDLVQAVQANDLSAATRLLNEGADPNGRIPPLTLFQKVQVDCFCLSRGTKMPPWRDMDQVILTGPLLETAVLSGNADMVSALLAKGADVSTQDKDMGTPLDMAEALQSVSPPGPQNGHDYSRIFALLKAASVRPRHLGNMP